MVKILNIVCVTEFVVGVILAFVLPHVSAYIFGGGLILGSVFTFLIGMGLGLLSLYQEQSSKKEHRDQAI
ncbi:F0F1-type ATP synthase assembly protein I [Pullulanibacillus pueri]|uniref:Uncharacterized protein n=1 Tax=Pullulanibacillus pueri TaxID=1437324 RepID=A0A8J2ZZ21_9BACL|nr:hypothetical protein [Pullulanibacillus pueri]MBM7683813.1 F0F1-type ATP synthase assembly protein I [Pullulanibacillus pueri]GGH87673.1 hypothetical protein GCM10007096_38230 [Pullulanibacillus pueri]